MGRKDKRFSINLHQQAFNTFHKMLLAGENADKGKSKQDKTLKDKIFSYSTFETYLKHTDYFIRWIKAEHPDCTTLRSAKKYINNFLEERCNTTNASGRPLSAWTIQLEAAALNKLYGIDKADVNRFQPPTRHRQDIIRSRISTAQDKHFSPEKNALLVIFCKSTGCRRNVLEKLEGRDYWTKEKMKETMNILGKKSCLSKDEKKIYIAIKDALTVFPNESDFLHHRKDKGGRDRFAPIIGADKSEVICKLRATQPTNKVWGKISKNADIHSYRADYASAIYKGSARDIKDIPFDKINHGSGKSYQSEVYACRGSFKGRKLDKAAMFKASKALGHNRLDVVANNYIRY